MDNEKVEKVLNWEIPRNGDDIKSFLGLCSYYRKFIAGFSKLAQPLYAASMVEAKNFIWTKNLDECFTKLKIALTTAPILAYPIFDDKNATYVMDIDGSDVAMVVYCHNFKMEN